MRVTPSAVVCSGDFQDAVEILITDRDGVIRVPSVFLTIASFNLQKQAAGQAQRAQVFPKALEHFSLTHKPVDVFVSRVFRRQISYLDPVRSQRGGFSRDRCAGRQDERKH
jgi:hypothetical protein